MTIILPRRRFLQGLAALIAAPAIVRFESLMPVHALPPEEFIQRTEWQWYRNGVPIPEAIKSTYVLQLHDFNSEIALKHALPAWEEVVRSSVELPRSA